MIAGPHRLPAVRPFAGSGARADRASGRRGRARPPGGDASGPGHRHPRRGRHPVPARNRSFNACLRHAYHRRVGRGAPIHRPLLGHRERADRPPIRRRTWIPTPGPTRTPSRRRQLLALRDRAKFLHEETDFVVCASHPVYGVFELGLWMCGFEEFMVRLYEDEPFVRRFFEIVLDYQLKVIRRYYSLLGPYIDYTSSGDDFATQSSLFLSPSMFRDLIAPLFQRAHPLHQTVHRRALPASLLRQRGAADSGPDRLRRGHLKPHPALRERHGPGGAARRPIGGKHRVPRRAGHAEGAARRHAGDPSPVRWTGCLPA